MGLMGMVTAEQGLTLGPAGAPELTLGQAPQRPPGSVGTLALGPATAVLGGAQAMGPGCSRSGLQRPQPLPCQPVPAQPETEAESCSERLRPHELPVVPRMLGRGLCPKLQGCRASRAFPTRILRLSHAAGKGAGVGVNFCAWTASTAHLPPATAEPHWTPVNQDAGQPRLRAQRTARCHTHPFVTKCCPRSPCLAPGVGPQPSKGEAGENLFLASRFQHLLD